MDDLVSRWADVTSRLGELSVDLAIRFARWVATSGARIILILILAWVAMLVTRRLLATLHRRFAGERASMDQVKRADTLTGIVRTIVVVFLWIAALMMVLNEVGLEIAPILATAGIGGLAIGFGAQTLVKDVISGFFLLVEDVVRVGDIVEVAGRGGVVERIGLRTIVLRDLSGAVHTIPNGTIDVIKNMTKDYSRYVFDVGVAYREDTDEVTKVLVGIMDGMREEDAFRDLILEPLEILGVDSFQDSAVIVRARVKTRAGSQWSVGREFNRRMKKRFDELGIEIPFPHVTIWAGEPKSGAAPALPLALTDSREKPED